ncbi:uncharacterized protein LOC144015002 isoform X2 [Festucalex cinctus]
MDQFVWCFFLLVSIPQIKAQDLPDASATISTNPDAPAPDTNPDAPAPDTNTDAPDPDAPAVEGPTTISTTPINTTTIGPVIGDGSSASGNPDFQNNASTEGRVYVHIKADVRHAVGVNVTEILQQFLFNLTLGLCDDCKVDINTTVTPDQITVF